jgi:carboxymethylenebutenolidase
MCFDHDALPPIAPMAGAAVDGQRTVLKSADGTAFLAFHAVPSTPSGAAILIFPDVRGLYPFYEELALRFAEAGVAALAIDYFGRSAGTADRPADFDFMSHVDRLRFEQVMADAAAGLAELRRSGDVRAAFSVGFCMGGRYSFVAGTRPELELAGVIGFYGPPVGAGRGGMPAPAEVAADFRCPVLGLFGGADQSIPPEARTAFDRALASAGVEHELVTYPGAPHSFFDRKAEQFADASADAWQRTLDFVRRHTPAA